uniref:Uncharacterized protein n=1 Tax=Rheinheimera sp. BAL341 TaxID=1708203 RepID=A0A486XLR7_9GAMM
MVGGNASLTVFDYSAPDNLLTSSSSHPWSINADGQIIVKVSEADSIEISLLAAEFSAKSPLLSVRTKFGEQHFAITSNAVVNENETWTNERIAGIHLLPENPARPQEFLWLELNPDGTALTVFHVDRNSDGEIIDSERQLMPGFWQIDAEGQLHVRRYRLRGGGYCEASTWQPLPTDDCQLYNNRIMLLQHLGPLSTQNEQEIGLIVDHRFYDSAFRGGSTGYPTLDYDLFAYGSFYGRIWKKVVQRPVSID